jgi:hypothetical protein
VLATLAHAQYQSDFAVADVNGDGKPDLIEPDGNTVAFYVFLGNGDGTIQPFTVITVENSSGSCASVAVADFNGDGKPDVVVGCDNGTGPKVAVMFGNGDGTFQPAALYPISPSPAPISIGDLNGDGKPDIIIGSGTAGASGPAFEILLNKGDGTFKVSDFALSDRFIMASTLADFNGDKKLDLAILRGNGDVRVYFGNGDGTFTLSHEYAVHAPQIFQGYLAVSDFNSDGKLDLIVTANLPGGKVPNTYAIMYGNGDGTFQAPQLHPGAKNATVTGVVTGDFNGDGKADFALDDWNRNKISVFLGNGDGTFQAPTNYPLLISPYSSLLLADLNGDGKPDIMAPSADISLINNGDGTFREVTLLPKQ